jgi:hypothetical protein
LQDRNLKDVVKIDQMTCSGAAKVFFLYQPMQKIPHAEQQDIVTYSPLRMKQ